jgi:hypothetical protein
MNALDADTSQLHTKLARREDPTGGSHEDSERRCIFSLKIIVARSRHEPSYQHTLESNTWLGDLDSNQD